MTHVERTQPTVEHGAERSSAAPWPSASLERGNPLWQMVVMRLRLFWRDRSAIFWVYIFPMLLLAALAVAFRNRPEPRFPVDVAEGPAAKQIAAALADDAFAGKRPVAQFDVRIVNEADGRERLRTGRSAILILPAATSGSAESLKEAWPDVALDYRYDPTRPESAAVREAVDTRLQHAAGRTDQIPTDDILSVEPGGRYVDFVLPGILGICIMMGGLFGVAMSTVDMRARHLLKRLVTTPMRKTDFLASLMLARFFFLITQAIFVLLFARYMFDVAQLGSWLTLSALVVVGCFAFSGLGLLAACRARTMETASGIANLMTMPMWLLSGIFFSPDRFPAEVQPVIDVLPLTPLVTGMRSVMLEGAGWLTVAPQLGILVAWTVVSFALALVSFRWE